MLLSTVNRPLLAARSRCRTLVNRATDIGSEDVGAGRELGAERWVLPAPDEHFFSVSVLRGKFDHGRLGEQLP